MSLLLFFRTHLFGAVAEAPRTIALRGLYASTTALQGNYAPTTALRGNYAPTTALRGKVD